MKTGIWESCEGTGDRHRAELAAYRADAGSLSDPALVVDIYLVELDGRSRGVLRECLKDGLDGPTRAAPASPEVNDCGSIPVYLILGDKGALSWWTGSGDVRSA